MKLYYSKGACSLAVRIAICEMNLPCKYESVDHKTKKTETGEDYLKINAKGAVPALMLDNKEVLTENAVIQQYLADTHHMTQFLPAVGDFKRYRALEWLNYVSTELHKGFAPFFNPKLPDNIKEEIFKPIMLSKFRFLDQHLSRNEYLLGEQFTLADGYLCVMILWCSFHKLDIAPLSNLLRYYADLKKREGVKKAYEEEGLPL